MSSQSSCNWSIDENRCTSVSIDESKNDRSLISAAVRDTFLDKVYFWIISEIILEIFFLENRILSQIHCFWRWKWDFNSIRHQESHQSKSSHQSTIAHSNALQLPIHNWRASGHRECSTFGRLNVLWCRWIHIKCARNNCNNQNFVRRNQTDGKSK